MVDQPPRGKRGLAFAVFIGVAALAGIGHAQSMTANSATYNAGYGRTTDQENQPVDASMRDANGNLVVVDGVIQAGQDQSVFSNAGASGAFDTVAGVGGAGAATAFGNNLVVVTEGDNNTVIVNSVQNNSGNVTASTSLTGGVSNAH
jgi:holdfast attachment protein HfaA